MSHPNPLKGEAEATLEDGRTLRLVFNANAWIAAEEVLGKTTPEILAEIASEKASLKTQRAIVWAGLRKHHPEIEIEEAGDLLVELAEAMSRGLTGGLPQAEEGASDDGEGPPRRKRGGAGTGR